MNSHIVNTLRDHETVTSTYVDIYLNNDHCISNSVSSDHNVTSVTKLHESNTRNDVDTEWISPSDLLIGKVELEPPFTSKITRGKTHEGILAIGNEVLEKEHAHFLASLNALVRENEECWNNILENERHLIRRRVKEIFKNIYNEKSKIMTIEVMKFYENTLQSLDAHLQSEVANVLTSVHASMISTLNNEIPTKLKKERTILEDVLRKNHKREVDKIVLYYKLLLNNELCENKKLINRAISNRNAALEAFCRQIDAERLTASMYIMSMERKKCKIKKMFLEKYQSSEVADKLTKIKERQTEIEAFKIREETVSDINKKWKEKMKKVLELFLKFVSFSLKLLPEQSTFLLDFQKMVVLQLNEMQKNPSLQSSILIDEDKLTNFFEFQTPPDENKECDLEPFFIEGDLSDSIPPRYGSTETLPSNVDLPFITVNRHYTYAKCHGYEDIKIFLKSQQCTCSQSPSPPVDTLPTPSPQPVKPNTPSEGSSSTLEPLLFDDILRLEECPARKCGYWAKNNRYQFLPSYLDFNEKNFERVKGILGGTGLKEKGPELIKVNDIACDEIPFAETKQKYRHVETQYSTEEFDTVDINCTCINKHQLENDITSDEIKKNRSQILTEALTKRKVSLRRLLDQNPNLLKVFTDESFDFQL